jgi:hypothetical protein
VLARLGKTLSTNAAIGGLALLVLGAGGTTASLVAGNSPAPTPNSHANANATDAADNADDADENADDAAEDANEAADDAAEGTRPTDTHGYCVSQVAKAETTSTEPGAHGTAVSAAAHACGKDGAASQADAHRQNGTHGKALGKNHGTGRPAGVTPGAASPR